MHKITPHLWFDKEAKEAAHLYTSIFPNSKIKSLSTLDNTPSGAVDIASIELASQEFRLISAGPMFKFTPAASFLVACETKEEVDALWRKLSQGGTVLMPLDQYPFSERYGWTSDRYGLSWQLMFVSGPENTQKITPMLMFTGNKSGKAEEAIRFYTSVFKNSGVGEIARYGKEDKPDKEGTIKFASFTLEDQGFAAMDSAREHNFNFNEAISFEVHCETQEELDYFWTKLSADPNSEQCGWLKDRYGFSWQIVPTALSKMLRDKDAGKVARVTQALLKMKKLDIAALQREFNR